MARAGLTAREEDFFIAAGRFEQAGYAAAKEALGRGDRPTAFIAAYDEVAFGAIRAFAESGLRVPEDLSIIGINDVPTASFAPAALTTIHAYVEEACGQAVDILLRKTAGSRLPDGAAYSRPVPADPAGKPRGRPGRYKEVSWEPYSSGSCC